MEDISMISPIPCSENLKIETDKPTGFMLEVQASMQKDRLQCYISNINQKYADYLKIKKEIAKGSNLHAIDSTFSNIYCKVISYFFHNLQEDSVSIYVKMGNEGLKIVDIHEVKNHQCKLWQIVAYTLNREQDTLRVVLITREVNYIENISSKDDFENYNDIIKKLSEVVSNLSHAWRQPLNNLNFSIVNLLDEMDSTETEDNIIETYYQEIWSIIKHLSQEIEKFKAFFEMDYEKKTFDITEYLGLVFEILDEKIKKENMKIDLQVEKRIFKYASPKEFLQLMYCIFFDIIENCKEILDTKNKKLSIIVDKVEGNIFFHIQILHDNTNHKNCKLYLDHLSMFNEVISKKMQGFIDLIDEGEGNKLIISFPLKEGR